MLAKHFAVAFIGCLAAVHRCAAQNATYTVAVDAVTLTDIGTGLEDIVAVHNVFPFEVYASLAWDDQTWLPDSNNTLSWKTSCYGRVVQVTDVLELV
jgi:hypothetical protein